jgi:hypothetical protein
VGQRNRGRGFHPGKSLAGLWWKERARSAARVDRDTAHAPTIIIPKVFLIVLAMSYEFG